VNSTNPFELGYLEKMTGYPDKYKVRLVIIESGLRWISKRRPLFASGLRTEEISTGFFLEQLRRMQNGSRSRSRPPCAGTLLGSWAYRDPPLHRGGRVRARGITIADTKFELALDGQGDLVLIDEALTPDSSRFWPADGYATGQSPPSFDKQFVRDYLETLPWDKKPPAPYLPPEIQRDPPDISLFSMLHVPCPLEVKVLWCCAHIWWRYRLHCLHCTDHDLYRRSTHLCRNHRRACLGPSSRTGGHCRGHHR
jgi:hypothetical protein